MASLSSTTQIKLNLPSHYKIYNALLQHAQNIVLCSLHMFLTCLQYASVQWQNLLWNKIRLAVNNITPSQIIKDAKRLGKSPRHMVVVINEDEIDTNTIVNVVVWSVFSGIPCITLCDRKGYLQKNSATLRQEYEARLQLLCKNDNLKCPTTQFHIEMLEPCSASHNVIITSITSGRRRLVNCMKSLSLDMTSNPGLKQQFNAATIDERLKDYIGITTEPDLTLSFGPYLSYFGFQPWNVRLTEIISLGPSHGNLTYRKFLGALETFARCEQRFGT